MPVYNGTKFIREALDSLLAQTFTDFELIISDNASTDDTEAICREYAAKDQRIRYVRQPENLGASANYKYVLDESVAEYFMWAAADDVWDEHWIATLLPIVTVDNGIAFGTVQSIDANGDPKQHPANGHDFTYKGSTFIRRLQYLAEPVLLGKANTINGIYYKHLIPQDIFHSLEKVQSSADMVFMYIMLGRSSIKGCQTVSLYKRVHRDSGSHVSLYQSNSNIFVKIIYSLENAVKQQYKYAKAILSHSTIIEQVVLIILFPTLLAYNYFHANNYFHVIRRNPRFRA